MSDEHIKLIAKIQHFYDFMIQHLNCAEDEFLSFTHPLDKTIYKTKREMLNSLSVEYCKTFENFLYKDSE